VRSARARRARVRVAPSRPRRSDSGGQGRPAGRRHVGADLGRAAAPGRPAPPQGPGRPSRRKPAARDSVTSLVLAVYAEVDRPLGFDQVVELAGNRVSRTQASTASSALCRDGQLDRIRSGVYQWSAGQRAPLQRIPATSRAAEPPGRLR
jgi:hypothetical protein